MMDMQMWPGEPTDWLSSHELLYSRGSASAPWELWKRDLRSGKDTCLKELCKQLRKNKAPLGWHQVSPNGQWVLCPSSGGITFCSIDGKQVFEHSVGWSVPGPRPPRGFRNPFGWMHDSRHWVELV